MSLSKIQDFAQSKSFSEIKLHLGCGGERFNNWVNIDNFDYEPSDTSRSGANYDLKMDIRNLDVEDGVVSAILTVHVIEHFVRWEALGLLAHWHSKLRSGGVLITEMPDLDKCIELYLLGTRAPHIDTPLGKLNQGKTQFFGNQWSGLDYETHRYVWTIDEFCGALVSTGFEILEATHDALFHMPGRDMLVKAVKR